MTKISKIPYLLASDTAKGPCKHNRLYLCVGRSIINPFSPLNSSKTKFVRMVSYLPGMQLHRGGPELRFREFRLKGIILVYKT